MSHKSGKRGQGQAPGDEVGQKFHCDNCQANVTDGVRISCNECSEFDLCTTCFSRGIELGSHKNDHSYRVVTRHRFPIFTEDWSADEELLLIDGLRQFGMGNWKDAAEHVGTKSKEECEQHYLSVYVGADSWPLPDMNKNFDVKFARLPEDKKGRASTSNKTKILSSQPSNHEIVGYMPGRLEFETEYENEAEQVIKDMCFNDDDPPEETELRQIVLKIYNNKLDRRLYRKGFILDRGLLEYRKNQAIEKKRPKEERDLLNKIKVFARMQTGEDFEEFSAGLLSEQALRQRITQLQEWRRNGITTLEDGAQYEVERAQRPSRRATTQRDSAHLLERLQKIVDSSAIRNPVSVSTSSLTAQRQQGRHPNNFLDVESADGAELLSKSERELCLQLRIFPQTYLTTKETLLSEYARTGHLRRRHACELSKIDTNKAKVLYSFFVQSGWIKSNFCSETESAATTTGASASVNSTPAVLPSVYPVATANSNSSQLVKKEY